MEANLYDDHQIRGDTLDSDFAPVTCLHQHQLQGLVKTIEVVKFKFRFRIYQFSSYVAPSQIVSSRNGMVGRRFNGGTPPLYPPLSSGFSSYTRLQVRLCVQYLFEAASVHSFFLLKPLRTLPSLPYLSQTICFSHVFAFSIICFVHALQFDP